MQSIQIITDGGRVTILINGAEITGVQSFTLEYVRGCPVRFSCVADAGKPTQRDRILH